MDDLRYLQGLISEGEHQQQDFKYRVEDARKLARSVSAFANTSGGRLLIGVRDDGCLCGVRSEEEIYVMHQAAYRYCRPEASIKFDTYHVARRGGMSTGNCTIVVATVPKSDHRPVCAIDDDGRQRAYIRIADENIVASPVHLCIWREEQSAKSTTFTYGEAEKRLLAVLADGAWRTLNQLVRQSRLPRPKVIALTARLIRYGLIDWQLDSHQFVFRIT
ncbi:MAG: ATP-binding protein [Prevotella sp.]|jgi:predicted HTH transcriptional regulator|nr:ATP-binding protein [Prevotella sp.]MBR6320298.1 ATP-binding protein [Prevotella sp.]